MTARIPVPPASAPAAAPSTVLRNRAEAEVYVASVCFKHGPPKLLGAELEWVVQHSGNPHRPLQAHHLVDALGRHAPSSLVPDSAQIPLLHGSTVTVEPGGQLEISSPPCSSLTDLITTVDGDTSALTELLEPAGLVLGASGADPYRPSRRLIDIPRYAAMETAFDRIGPMGRAMMCSTAAVQVCVDAGTRTEVAQRWAALHDLGPVLLAAFANSPWLAGARTGWMSSRMRAWFALDPVRTMPPPVQGDPATDWACRALETPLLCQRRPGGSWDVPKGVTFADWLAGALPGRPSTADLDYHLTTLFPPVRPHGHLEVRYLDAQPPGQWLLPVAVVAAVLADPAVTAAARDACAPAVGRWFEAAKHGLRDDVLATAAAAVFDLACRALPALHAPPGLQLLLEEITEVRVRRGRCPADDAVGDLVGDQPGRRKRDPGTSTQRTYRRSAAVSTPMTGLGDAALRDYLATELERSRARSTALIDALDDGELVRQHSPIMSPLVWDFAHIGNQEELWLVRDVGGRDPLRADIDQFYDAFKHPRQDRPALPLLDPAQARGYVGEVRRKALDVLERIPLEGRPLVEHGFAFGMIVQHEQQHDETMLATHQLRNGTVALHAPDPRPARAEARPAEILIAAGEFTMGTSTEPWALDNERPAHPARTGAYWLDTTPVSNGDYQRFLADGGYDEPRWWSERGWTHRCAAGLVAPQFWQRAGQTWWRTRFGGTEPVPADEPVVHVCFFEAQAYAAWAGKRLPTETEWEKAARFDPATGRSRRFPWGDEDPTPAHANLGQRHLQPAPVGSYPAGASPLGVHQLIGDVWEWTSSGFSGYPGFTPFPYREYSEVFLGGDYRMLRGGSFGTDAAACRGTFRNWDHPYRRQIFAGFRCARDAEQPDLR